MVLAPVEEGRGWVDFDLTVKSHGSWQFDVQTSEASRQRLRTSSNLDLLKELTTPEPCPCGHAFWMVLMENHKDITKFRVPLFSRRYVHVCARALFFFF